MVSLDRGSYNNINSVSVYAVLIDVIRSTLHVSKQIRKKFTILQAARFFNEASDMDVEPILAADGESHFKPLKTVPAFR